MSKRSQLRNIENLLQRLDAAIVVRDLGNARSADAFEGLRKSILVAAKSRRTHISHLVSLDESIRNGGSLDLVKARLGEYLNELGIERLTDLRHLECFDIVGDPEGEVEILESAVVERAEDGKLTILRVGKAKRTFTPKAEEPVGDHEPVIELLVKEEDEEAPTAKPNKGLTSDRRRFVVLVAVVLAVLATVLVRSCGNSDNNLDPKETPTSDSPTSTAPSSTLPTTTTTTTG